jgi:hypothetical protein
MNSTLEKMIKRGEERRRGDGSRGGERQKKKKIN